MGTTNHEPAPIPEVESIGEIVSRIAGSTLVKLGVLAVLGVVLLIPVGLVLSLVHERQSRLHQVQAEVAATWGKPQTLIGPILVVPFHVRDKAAPSDSTKSSSAPPSDVVILPNSLRVTGTLQPERRRRGIFETVVYTARVQLSGGFSPPDLGRLGISAEDVDWHEARLLFSVADPHGLTRPVELRWADTPQPLAVSGAEPPVPGTVLTTAALAERGEWDKEIPFAVDLALRGTGRLDIAPVGAENAVSLQGPWGSPNFVGGFLPSGHNVSEQRFTASWQVSEVSRSYPQEWRQDRVDPNTMAKAFAESTVGVDLTIPADAYQQTERTAKYAILFIALTFGTFLLCELATRNRLHPIQYLLVGAAQCLYYLLLLALTEHLGFKISYWLSSAATILLISAYARTILASRKLALALLGWLTALYGYLYFILRLEDYALLAGALGLFVLLATFMWTTRRLDWYSLTFRRQSVDI